MNLVRKPFFVFNVLTVLALAAHAQSPSPEFPEDLDRLKSLVAAGAAPRAALEKAQAALDDKTDDAILKRTLYGSLKLEDVTEKDVTEMVAAAQRRLHRVETRLGEIRPLVEDGIYARSALAPLEQDVAERENTLRLAQHRAAFIQRLAEMAAAEQAMQTEPDSGNDAPKPAWERFDGKREMSPSEWKVVRSAFEHQFGKPLPVSAFGNTAVHRALGFDHTGRLDVALNPDTPEGLWLRQFLERERIPYFAFREAIERSATGAHIHIGPPSVRRAD
jgi:hypothetical protein